MRRFIRRRHYLRRSKKQRGPKSRVSELKERTRKRYFLTQILANPTQILTDKSANICVQSAKICVQKGSFWRLKEPGVFETMRSYNGKVFKFDEHLERLFNSANSIGISLSKKPFKKTLLTRIHADQTHITTDLTREKSANICVQSAEIRVQEKFFRDYLKNLIESRFEKNKIEDGSIRVAINRDGDVDIIFRRQKIYQKEFYERGVEVVSVPVRRNLVESQNPKIKSGDFLWGVMARIDLANYEKHFEGSSEKVFFNADIRKSNADGRRFTGSICENPRAICENLRSRKIFQVPFEAILLNRYGYVTEGTVSNIFIVKDNKLIPPPGYCGILEGITRKYVIELAKKLKIKFREAILTRHDIYNADEAFLTNTSMEIMPVVRFDGRTIGSGRPGEITKRLISVFNLVTSTR